MKKKVLFFGSLVLIFSIIIYNIYQKVQISKRAAKPVEFAVGMQVLKKEKVNITYEFNGLLEGDPQVKVYSDVSGKFIRNAVSEGDYVRKGSTVAYIDRDIIGQEFQPAVIMSPINGIVKKLYFTDRGTAVNISLPVAEIANTERVKVVVNIGQEYIGRIKKGMPVRISPVFDSSTSIQSAVSSVTPFVDSDTLTGSFEVRAPGVKGLPVGSSVRVNVITGNINAFMVPLGAVNMGMDDIYIFVNNKGKARKVSVTQGYIRDDKVEIKGDINEGDEIITEGSFKLSDGSAIKSVNSQPK